MKIYNFKKKTTFTVDKFKKNDSVGTYPVHSNRVTGRCEILTAVKLHCNATYYLTLAM